MKTLKENVRHMYYTNVYKKIESTGALQLIIRWTYRGTELVRFCMDGEGSFEGPVCKIGLDLWYLYW